MQKFLVCKTVVAYGQGQTQFMLFLPTQGSVLLPSLMAVATYFRANGGVASRAHIKNEAPADIIRIDSDDDLPDSVVELERLSKNEVAELAGLLRK